MTDRELMQMALDALEYPGPSWPDARQKAAEALRARLAQPEQEPFEYWNAVEGWVKIEEVRQHFDTAGCGTIYKTGGEGRVPLYAASEWQGLTDKEIENCFEMSMFGTCRAIEAKLKEKNAPYL